MFFKLPQPVAANSEEFQNTNLSRNSFLASQKTVDEMRYRSFCECRKVPV